MPKSRTPVKPRGSVGMAAALEVPLSFDEYVPFLVGFRMYRDDPPRWRLQPPDIDDVSPFLKRSERRALTELGDDFFRRWVTIGAMWSAVVLTIEGVRRA